MTAEFPRPIERQGPDRGFAVKLSAAVDAAVQSRYRRFLLFVIPVAWVLTLHLGPLLQMVYVSFRETYPARLGAEPVYTVESYASFFSATYYYIPLMRSLGFAAATTVATLVIVYPIAYFIARHAGRSKQFRYLMLILVPFWAGDLVRAFSLLVFLGNRGAVNQALMWIGLIDEPIQMLYTPFSLGMGIMYFSILFMLFPLYAAIEKIPASLMQAGADLGAGPFRRFWQITLPLSRDGVVLGSILVFLHGMGTYAVPLLIGGSGQTLFAQTIADFFYAHNADWPSGAAFSIIMLLTVLPLVAVVMIVFGSRDGAKTR